jgi:tetratricopeptide (TPR) repeat protein
MGKLRLDSWKSIANHLNRGQRTVQRWHAEHGLPVHHFGGTQGCVFAYVEDLDDWLAGVGAEPVQTKESADQMPDGQGKRSSELTAVADELWATHSEGNLGKINELYRSAIEIDPGNIRALTGLANAMIASSLLEVVDSSVAHTCAMEALRRAPQVDTQHPDAKCGAAFLKMVHERKWRQARTAFEDLLREQPSHAFGLKGRAFLHIADAELSEASSCAWEAWRQTPLASSPRVQLCWIEFLAGNSEEAIELVDQFMASGSSGPMMAAVHALALSQAAPNELDLEQLESMAAEFPKSPMLQGVLGYANGISGRIAKASQVLTSLQDLSERKKRNHGYALALALLGLNKKQEAISWLETSFEQGSVWSLGFRSDPILKPLRGEPRFESLLCKIGSRPEARAIDKAKSPQRGPRLPAAAIAAGAWIGPSKSSLANLEGLKEPGAA